MYQTYSKHVNSIVSKTVSMFFVYRSDNKGSFRKCQVDFFNLKKTWPFKTDNLRQNFSVSVYFFIAVLFWIQLINLWSKYICLILVILCKYEMPSDVETLFPGIVFLWLWNRVGPTQNSWPHLLLRISLCVCRILWLSNSFLFLMYESLCAFHSLYQAMSISAWLPGPSGCVSLRRWFADLWTSVRFSRSCEISGRAVIESKHVSKTSNSRSYL